MGGRRIIRFYNTYSFDVLENSKDKIRKQLRKQYDGIEALPTPDDCMRLSNLNLIYENIDVLVNGRNFRVLPMEIFCFMEYIEDAGILSANRLNKAFIILAFKHDEKNPFPSHQLLMRMFNKGKRAITNAISDIVKSGLFINEKGKYGLDKRKNTYNVSPFLNLLGLFVEAFREGRDIDIMRMYKEVISGKLKARKVSEE